MIATTIYIITDDPLASTLVTRQLVALHVRMDPLTGTHATSAFLSVFVLSSMVFKSFDSISRRLLSLPSDLLPQFFLSHWLVALSSRRRNVYHSGSLPPLIVVI